MNNPRPPGGFLPLILLSLLLAGRLFGSALAAETDAKAPAKESEKPKPEAQLWVTKHTNHVGNATLAYTATAGTMLMKDDLWKKWDERHQLPDVDEFKAPFANTSVDLMYALSMNPKMKVLIHQGYFDLAVPYRTVEYVLDHLELSPELRANIRIEYYEAGHMMYVHPPSRQKFKQNTAEFIRANLR